MTTPGVAVERVRKDLEKSSCTHSIAVIYATDTMLSAPWLIAGWQIGQFDEGHLARVECDHDIAEYIVHFLKNFAPAIFDVRLFGKDEARKIIGRQAIDFAMSSIHETVEGDAAFLLMRGGA